MSKKINEKTILITGASTGIGEACVAELARKGNTVFAGVRKEADAEKLRELEGDVRPVLMDVTDEAQVKRALEEVTRALGERGLDGLVNNAGTSVTGALERLPLEMFRFQMDLNVTAQLIVTQAFLPLLRRSAGRIVFMSSVSGLVARPFLGPYCASKFALEALADSFRAELRPWSIGVSVVEPGPIRTAIWDKGGQQLNAALEALGEDGRELYGEQVEQTLKMADTVSKRLAIPPAKVVKRVEHALMASRPKTRYRVGAGSTMDFILKCFIPDRLGDVIIRKSNEWIIKFL